MFVNSIVAALVLTTAGTVAAQGVAKPGQLPAPTPTIGQLAEQARAKRMAEDNARGAANGAPVGAPAGMVIVPSTQIITGAAVAPDAAAALPKKPVKPVKKEPPPEFIPAILGIYRKGSVRTVELVESTGNARFDIGQVTPSGWTVMAIAAQRVELGKADPKTGAMRKVTLQLVGN